MDAHLESCFWDNCRFVDCKIEGMVSELSSFGLGVFERTTFTKSRLSEVSFIGSVWRDCCFEDENHSFVRFPGALFINTRFVNSTLRKGIFRAARFVNCRFESCRLGDAVFHNADFSDTVFVNTDITEAANIEGVKGL